MKTNFILGTYKNGNYQVTMLHDGTKIRRTDDDEFIPEFPENADVKITDKCSQGCPFCYEGCTRNGKHAELIDKDGNFAQHWMNTLHSHTELAINGNDLDHPDIEKFLIKMKENHIIVNITVNQNQFMKNLSTIRYFVNENLVYGIGVSLVKANDELFETLKEFPNAVIHTIAGILKLPTIELLKKNHVKVLILGYKNLGRGIDFKKAFSKDIEDAMQVLRLELPNMTQTCKVVSFDNLAIEQLGVKELLFKDNEDEWNEFYMGDDGNFTLYIDAVNKKFAKNSCMPINERFPIGNKTMTEMFNFIRKRYGIIK